MEPKNDIISYLSWCEIQGIEPFAEDENEKNDNNEEIDIDEEKKLIKERRNNI